MHAACSFCYYICTLACNCSYLHGLMCLCSSFCALLNCMCGRGGLVGDHERYSATAALLSKGLESWGDQGMAALKEEGSAMPQPAAYNFYGSHLAGGGDHEMPAPAGGAKQSQLSQMLLQASSPRSCITTSLGSNMLDFSNSAPVAAPEMRSHHHHSDNSSEVRSYSSVVCRCLRSVKVFRRHFINL